MNRRNGAISWIKKQEKNKTKQKTYPEDQGKKPPNNTTAANQQDPELRYCRKIIFKKINIEKFTLGKV